MSYVGVFGLKITVETGCRWLLTISDYMAIFVALGCKKMKKLSYQGVLGLKMTIGTRAYVRESWFLEVCWYSIDSPGANGHFETNHT